MNMDRAGADLLARDIADRASALENPIQIVVFSSSVFFQIVGAHTSTAVTLGGQDCHHKVSGAHTGDISAPMLKEAGCEWVLLGHSERRTDHGESSELIAAKAEAALSAGLKIMICVGESLAEREGGQAYDIVTAQLIASLPAGVSASRLAIAYEPVWAIGTGQVASPEDVDKMHNHIRSILEGRDLSYAGVDILYGGSVKPENAAELLALPNVGGALVGGASLKADDFMAIVACAEGVS